MSTQTDLDRGHRFSSWLVKEVNSGMMDGPLNILHVGLGSSKFFGGSYEAYTFFSVLEEAEIDYNLTVVDIEQRLLDDFLIREEFQFGLISRNAQGYPEEYMSLWDQYLLRTGQEKVVLENAQQHVKPDLRDIFRDNYSDQNIYSARVPRELANKLRKGEVNLVQGDIKNVDLRQYGPFDAVSCQNVLYHLGNRDVQKLPGALNISRNVRKGGAVYLDIPWWGNDDLLWGDAFFELCGLKLEQKVGEPNGIHRKVLEHGLPGEVVTPELWHLWENQSYRIGVDGSITGLKSGGPYDYLFRSGAPRRARLY
ncbi:class I SAM-dependent methyltransferase [archaeon]|jgi:hypothetical protein|nr:class I SAM-dependent methyltransferase [archaeon]MBT6697760.1 class I SAM-dependent methyltransferase [archaeon]